jgi:Putative ATPase subunit of terminase (gpP-like)
MAKDNEKQIAYTLYVDQCLTAKEIALKLHVSEKTVGNWAEKNNWKDIKLSKQTTIDTLLVKYNELLSALLDKRLKFEKKIDKSDEDKQEYNGVIDEMSKVSSMIDKIQKDGTPSLRIHIMCLEKFMGALHNAQPKVFMQLLEFQIEYLQLLAEELK